LGKLRLLDVGAVSGLLTVAVDAASAIPQRLPSSNTFLSRLGIELVGNVRRSVRQARGNLGRVRSLPCERCSSHRGGLSWGEV